MNRTREWLVGYAVAACVAIGVGHEIADAMRPAPAPVACADQRGTLFNECARLDTTQVQDRRTDAPAPAPVTVTVTTTAPLPAPAPAPESLPPCLEEDGSTPGQAFPCRWDGTTQGNGQGDSYTLPGPA
jgi:hypothetical protein